MRINLKNIKKSSSNVYRACNDAEMKNRTESSSNIKWQWQNVEIHLKHVLKIDIKNLPTAIRTGYERAFIFIRMERIHGDERKTFQVYLCNMRL